MPKRTSDYRTGFLEELRDPQMAAHYLNAALEDSDEMFLKALRNVAEARQMAKVAKGAGVSRESIYRILSPRGNPRLSTLWGLFSTLGLRIVFQPSGKAPRAKMTRRGRTPDPKEKGKK